jgi:hypothetical protein
MERARGIPVLVDPGGKRSRLERIRLGSGNHDENWLQELIQAEPSILPIADIEPGFGDPVAAAREVPCGHGFIDNLFLTPSGDIILVETKLWRNSEIRREVVAQALDYVAALTSMDYSRFEKAISKGMDAPQRIYELFADQPEALEEPDFIDAVSRNLKRGRILVMVLGDGIRSETEALTDLLQSHAGAHFTFALVELATWKAPSGAILAVPDVLSRTVMIERGIVRFEGTGVTIEPPPPETKPRAQSISMGDFMGLMAERNPALPGAINAFIDAVEPFGVYPELRASLLFKIDLPEIRGAINFGYIAKNGKFCTDMTSGKMPESVWHSYSMALASLIGGSVKTEPSTYVIERDGSTPFIDRFLPEHLDQLVDAIASAIQQLREEVSA